MPTPRKFALDPKGQAMLNRVVKLANGDLGKVRESVLTVLKSTPPGARRLYLRNVLDRRARIRIRAELKKKATADRLSEMFGKNKAEQMREEATRLAEQDKIPDSDK